MRNLVIGFLAGALLSACTPQSETSSQRLSTQNPQAALDIVSRVPANAARIRAEGRLINAQGAVVTYSGAPRDYIACATAPNTEAGNLSLDTRTTIVAAEAAIISKTIYVVTMAKPGAASTTITFGSSGVGQFGNGTTCQATSVLESALLGT